MKTKTIKIYDYQELSKDAKEYAIEKYRETNIEIFWENELLKSLQSLFEHCNNVKLKDYSLGEYNSWIIIDFSYDEVENFTGKRAMAWIENNLLTNIRIPYKHKNKKEYLKYGDGYKSGQIKCCPFTGYCADDEFLDSLLKDIKEGCDLKSAFEGLASVYQRIIQNEIEYQNSEEYIREHFDANGYQFYKDGSICLL